MMDSTIYSIGHGNKKIVDFINELKSFNIQFLLDVRSKPYSKWNPQFNQKNLELEVAKYGITYIFVGDVLGGRPEDKSCYDKNGKVIYSLIKQKEYFKKGLERLIIANEKKINLVIMCSETKPEDCHRSKLIGQELLNRNIFLKHIISVQRIKSQLTVMNELTHGSGSTDLFGNELDLSSRKSY